MSSLKNRASYTRNPARLVDLIAAIQVLGAYKFSSRITDRWLKRLGRNPVSAADWDEIFSAHPEFFTRDDQGLVSLVWRRNKERNYDTHTRQTLPRDEASAIAQNDPESTATRLSRVPLDTDEISKLIEIAISLHEREIRHQQEKRWWITASIAAIGVLVGLLGRLG